MITIMMQRLFFSIITLLILLFYRNPCFTQNLPSPTVRTLSILPSCPTGVGANILNFWNSVSGATSYRFDIAEDSLFIRFVPGLKNVPNFLLRIPNVYSGSDKAFLTAPTFSGLSPGMTFYARARAVNENMVSPSSSPVACTTKQNGWIYLRTQEVSDTSIAIEYRVQNGTVVTSLPEKLLITISPGNQSKEILIRSGSTAIQGIVTFSGLMPNQIYSYEVKDYFSGVARTYPKALAPFAKLISFYEGPLPHNISSDTSNFYYLKDTIGLTSSRAEEILIKLSSAGFFIDTAWVHPAGAAKISLPVIPSGVREDYSSVNSACIVKLKVPDSRILQHGFVRGVGWWQLSESFDYHRYAFNGKTSVSMPQELKPVLRVYPQPANEMAKIVYSVCCAGSVRIVIQDVLGRTIDEKLNKEISAPGIHETEIDTRAFSSGFYTIRLVTESLSGQSFSQTTNLYISR